MPIPLLNVCGTLQPPIIALLIKKSEVECVQEEFDIRMEGISTIPSTQNVHYVRSKGPFSITHSKVSHQ